jgi:hypothetical protein
MNKTVFFSKMLTIVSLFWAEAACSQTLSRSTKKYLPINIQSIETPSTGSLATNKGINPYICADFLKQWGAKPIV